MATINLGAIKFNWRGAYAGGTAYTVDDVVSSGGSSYVCILASTGNAVSNATYWSVMAEGGDVATTLTTQGDVLYRDGSGLQRLAKGTASQALKMNSGATAPEWATDEGGTIVQIVQKYKTDVSTLAGSAYATFIDVSGFSQAITPTKAGSKILVDLRVVIGNTTDYGSVKVQADINSAGYNDIGMPDTAGSRTKGWVGNTYNPSDPAQTKTYSGSYLWTPTYTLTDVLTFKLKWSMNSGTIALNRSAGATDNTAHVIGTSSLTLWEIN